MSTIKRKKKEMKCTYCREHILLVENSGTYQTGQSDIPILGWDQNYEMCWASVQQRHIVRVGCLRGT